MRAIALIAVALLAVFVVFSTATFADDPPGKQDSPVSLLLLQSIKEGEDTAIQGSQQPVGDAVTRPLQNDYLVVKYATESSSCGYSDSSDVPVWFDSSGNVQVYIHLENTDGDTLQEPRDLGADIEITNSNVNEVQASVHAAALDDIAALDAVEEITAPDYGQTPR